MDRSKSKELDFSAFPSLSLCAVIDSRFSSRSAILNDLADCRLFEDVIEAKSIEHAKEILNSSEVDACIIGPSVTPELTADFINAGLNVVQSKDCAFIVIVNPGSDAEEELLRAGAHGILSKPYGKGQLGKEVVESVLRANHHCPWKEIYKKQFAAFESNGKSSKDSASPEAEPPSKLQPKAFVEALTFLTPLLRELSEGHEHGDFGLLMDGSPNKPAAKRIDEIISEVSAAAKLEGEASKIFTSFLQSSVLQWYREMVLTGAAHATDRLNRTFGTIIKSPMQNKGA